MFSVVYLFTSSQFYAVSIGASEQRPIGGWHWHFTGPTVRLSIQNVGISSRGDHMTQSWEICGVQP